MKGRRASFRQSDAARALRAALAAGLEPTGYTISVDGSITVRLGDGESNDNNSFDRLMRSNP